MSRLALRRWHRRVADATVWRVDRGAAVGAAIAIAASALMTVSSAAQTASTGPAASGAVANASFVRRSPAREGGAQLEVATRSYRRGEAGPVVALVGAVHIADASYFDQMQRSLDEHAVVLYESVAPRGVERSLRRRGADRVELTRDSMLYLRRMMLLVREADQANATEPAKVGGTGAAPSLERTLERAPSIDSRAGAWIEAALRDAWGGAIELEAQESGGFVLISRGEDGAPGGEAEAADIRLRTPPDRRAPASSADDGLQAGLAAALGLSFQLTAMNYGGRHWELADMSEREFSEALGHPDDGSTATMRTLTGASMTAGLARSVLAMLRLADGVSGGRLRELTKLMLIEALAASSEQTLKRGLPPKLMEVILVRRNEVVWEELAARLAGDQPPESIAIFYGAAHMPDLERRLLAEGWRAVDERWVPAMSANARAAGLDASDEAMLRGMIRDALRDAGLDEAVSGRPAGKVEP